MDRAIIRKGDRTSHGGIVIEGEATCIVDGQPAACIGHKVYCPKCRGTYPIIEGAMSTPFMGASVALDGMKTACGAILIASQQFTTVEYSSENRATAGKTAQSTAVGNTLSVKNTQAQEDDYDQHFQVYDEHTVQ